ncbi:hypothetical protein HYV64_04475 [Candidatus Shapirobacteria bacterium]|nr:hypothetical protein [Candidatus Shapirobacteria bacterium]
MDNVPNQNLPSPQSVEQQKTSSNLAWLKTLTYGFSLVSFGIAIGVIGSILTTNKNQQTSQNQQIISPTIPQPSPTPDPTANWKTYEGTNFSFKYPSTMYIQKQTTNETRWKSDYVPGSYIFNAMILRSKITPFIKLEVGTTIYRYHQGEDSKEVFTEIINGFDENKKITLGEKEAQSYIYNCGPDCYYHAVYFYHGNLYYELVKYIAGGGSEAEFQKILSTFRFD